MKTVIEMARESNLMDSRDDWGSVPIEYEVAINAFAELVRADERERIKQENAPVIASINAHIQTLEEAAIRARGQA